MKAIPNQNAKRSILKAKGYNPKNKIKQKKRKYNKIK